MTRQFEDDKPQRRADDRVGYNCEYRNGGLSCKYPGTTALQTGGTCYCRVHIRDKGNLIAQQALEKSQTWRAPDVEREHDAKVQAWLDERFPRRVLESDHDYAMRLKEHCKAMLGGFKLKLVTDPPPQRMREPGEDMVEV